MIIVYARNIEKFEQYADALQLYDNNLITLIGVQYYLFAKTIKILGTDYHHQKYLAAAQRFELKGCFALTGKDLWVSRGFIIIIYMCIELGHGSNTKCIETTAIYDQRTKEFVINSPTVTSQKCWIGLASGNLRSFGTMKVFIGLDWCVETAEMAVVWAQLYVNQVDYGIHAFLVPLRNKDGSLAPHVRVMDNGHKPGLNGVDNGRIMFANKHIPKENLLNRYGDIDSNGNYSSALPNSRLVFAFHMGKPWWLYIPMDIRISERLVLSFA
jgi:acyl-CoA oxidase